MYCIRVHSTFPGCKRPDVYITGKVFPEVYSALQTNL